MDNLFHYLGVATPILLALSYAMFYYIKKSALEKYPIIKINYRIIYALLTLSILAIFSVGSGLFDAYNKTSREPYRYDWMNFNDLISFPFDALSVEKRKPKQAIIKEADITSSVKKYNYVVAIDMTGSTKPKFQDHQLLVNSLKQNILNANILGKDQPQDIYNKLADINDIRNLYALNILASIYEQSSAPVPADISYNFIYYLGDVSGKRQTHIVFGDQPRPYSYRDENSEENYKSYTDAWKELSSRFQEASNEDTDLSSLIDMVADKRYLECQDDRKNIVFFFSDFCDEIKGTIPTKAISALNTPKNDIVFFDLTEKWQNQSVDKKKWDAHFPKATKRFLDYSTDFNLVLNSSPVISSKESALYFVYPFLDDENRSRAQSRIDLGALLDQERHGDLTVRFYADGRSNEMASQILFDLHNYQQLRIGDLTELNYDRDKPLAVSLNSSYLIAKKHDLFFSAKSIKTGKSVSLPIRFIEKVPKSHGHILSLSYLFILLLLVMNSVLYAIFTIKNLRGKINTLSTQVWRARSFWILQILMVIALSAFSIKCFIFYPEPHWLWKLGILVIFIVYWYSHHYMEIKYGPSTLPGESNEEKAQP